VITFIIANKNRFDFIDRCISSLNKVVHPKEIIVVDSMSTDGSLEFLTKYADTLINEIDESVYEAWNKAILCAQGDWIFFMNTDDELLHQNFDMLLDQLKRINTDLVSFYVEIVENTNNSKIRVLKPKFSFRNTISKPIVFNGILFKRSVFTKIGLFDQNFKFCADQDFIWRCLLEKLTITFIPLRCYRYYSHPNSITLNGKINFFNEELRIAEKHLNRQLINDYNKFSKLWVSWERGSLKFPNHKLLRFIYRLFNPRLTIQQLYNILN
jgi:glycosyltransferase involved in cell wall biosynthesis